MDTAEKLIKIKNKIERAERDELELTGSIKNDLSRLSTDFDCDDLDQAETLINNIDGEIEKNEKLLETGVAELVKKFEL